MNICYWCGEIVLEGEGGREHILPRTLLQDAEDSNWSQFILPKRNAHRTCNNMIANTYEHDFCQMIFFHAFDDPRAKRHNASKIRNLENRRTYAANQFKNMKLTGDKIKYTPTKHEDFAFEVCIKKIIKGLSFMENNLYLDLEKCYAIRIDRDTMNLEYKTDLRNRVVNVQALFNEISFVGNSIFKFRKQKTIDGDSWIWEFLFYDRFPVHAYLIRAKDKIKVLK